MNTKKICFPILLFFWAFVLFAQTNFPIQNGDLIFISPNDKSQKKDAVGNICIASVENDSLFVYRLSSKKNIICQSFNEIKPRLQKMIEEDKNSVEIGRFKREFQNLIPRAIKSLKKACESDSIKYDNDVAFVMQTFTYPGKKSAFSGKIFFPKRVKDNSLPINKNEKISMKISDLKASPLITITPLEHL